MIDAPWMTPEVKTAILGFTENGLNEGEIHMITIMYVMCVIPPINLSKKLSLHIILTWVINFPTLKQDKNLFWSAYKKVVNTKSTTNIPPIIENGIFISNFKKNADIFNDYFSNQCTINDNGSVLPRVVPKTEALLSRVSKEQIIKIINNFSFSKAHGHDGISVSIKIINNFSFSKAHGHDGIFVSMLKIYAPRLPFLCK